jgi:hypothetical protein
MTSGRDHTPAEHEGAVMDDEWHALEQYLLTRLGGAHERASAEPAEPPVPPIAIVDPTIDATIVPTIDPDDAPASPAAALGVPPARG